MGAWNEVFVDSVEVFMDGKNGVDLVLMVVAACLCFLGAFVIVEDVAPCVPCSSPGGQDDSH